MTAQDDTFNALNMKELSQELMDLNTFLYQLCLTLQAHATMLQTRVAALETHDNITPDPSTVF